MKKKAQKKKINKSKPLKDFDIVAHVVQLNPPLKFRSHNEDYLMLAAYINRYGLQIGALLKEPQNDELVSWDPFIWEEHIWLKYEETTNEPR